MSVSTQVLKLVYVKVDESNYTWLVVILHANGCNRFARSEGVLEFCNITDFPGIAVNGNPIASLPIFHALKWNIGHLINHLECLLVKG